MLGFRISRTIQSWAYNGTECVKSTIERSALTSVVQAYRAPPVAEDAKQSSALDAPLSAAQRQSDAAISEFAQRLASRYNPRHTKPGTTPDQRAADVF